MAIHAECLAYEHVEIWSPDIPVVPSELVMAGKRGLERILAKANVLCSMAATSVKRPGKLYGRMQIMVGVLKQDRCSQPVERTRQFGMRNVLGLVSDSRCLHHGSRHSEISLRKKANDTSMRASA